MGSFREDKNKVTIWRKSAVSFVVVYSFLLLASCVVIDFLPIVS